MENIDLPEIIKTFLEALEKHLAQYKSTLTLSENLLNNKQPGIIIQIENAPWQPELIIHQTQQSLETEFPVYRARLGTSLPDELSNWVRDKANISNRFVSISALMVSEKSVDVVTQSILTITDLELTAYMFSIATIFGATSITESIKNELEKNNEKIGILSAWTDIDFEQIHYEYAHLGSCHLSPRHWSMNSLLGTVELDGTHNHPFWKAGLLSLQYYNKKQYGIDNGEINSNNLNQMSFLLDNTPMYGAWVEDKENMIFTTFLPNFMKGVPDITDHLVKWFMERSGSFHDYIELIKKTSS